MSFLTAKYNVLLTGPAPLSLNSKVRISWGPLEWLVMPLRKSRELQQAEKKWVGKRIRYHLYTLKRDKSLDGPYTGVVDGVSNNEAMIQDRLEGKDGRNSIAYTGTLFVVPDDGKSSDDWVADNNAEILEA